jgi:hypothetical protein
VLVGISAMVVIPLTLLQTGLVYTLSHDESVARKLPNGRVELGPGFWKAIVAAVVAGVISLLITQLVTGATTRAAIVGVAGGRPAVGESYRFAWKLLGSLLLVSLLTALVVFGGFVLLIIPGIVFGVRLVATVPALIAENLRGREALRRSWRLVKGDGWMVFGVLLVAGLLAAVVGLLFSAPFREDAWVQQGLAAAAASTLTTPFLTCLIVLIYLDLRARKEGLDREGLARELGGEPAP